MNADDVQVLLEDVSGIGRVNEPVVVGVPFAAGSITDTTELSLTQPDQTSVACQFSPLAHWPDGSLKWASAVFLTSLAANDQTALLVGRNPHRSAETQGNLHLNECDDDIYVDTGCARFTVSRRGDLILAATERAGIQCLARDGVRLISANKRGSRRAAVTRKVEVVEQGPVRAIVRLSGRIQNATCIHFVAQLSFFADTGLVKVETTIQNPSRAKHSGGYWDLGDPGSELFREIALEIASSAGADRNISWIESPQESSQRTTAAEWEIRQESSGGVNWDSRNHLNRFGRCPWQYRGYRTSHDGQQSAGLRAQPVVSLDANDFQVTASLTEFWQKFPSSLQVSGHRLRIGLLPASMNQECHELQGGEHTTRVAWLNFGRPIETACQQLAWSHDPLVPHCRPVDYSRSGAIWCLPDPDRPMRSEAKSLLDEAISTGPTSLFAKRETVDEYGWRHFGDMWGDHEQAYCNSSPPVLSHCNNKYDPLYGLLIQFLLTGDERWWHLADPLARHVMDIDIYHTSHDKAAYNGGMFWHTAHYQDAATSTHRTFSRAMQTNRGPVAGGGPGNENNYSSGLLLYHYLTGDQRARETVIGLADWVIAMDCGRKHTLGVVSIDPTGLASATASFDYHGPGRGAGNSINTLMDGFIATGNDRYLEKAETLIRRTIHPRDKLEDRQLGNAELRWSYTVYLQVLLRYIDLATRIDKRESLADYARQSVLHYVRWMVEHERYYLDEPDALEFPTETWAAQDVRKGVVMWMAARFANGRERERLIERANEILDQAWRGLMEFPSRTYSRPVTLALQQCYLETWLRHSPFPVAPANPDELIEEEPMRFIPQKQRVREAMTSPTGAAKLLAMVLRPSGWKNVIPRSWPAECLRMLIARTR